MLFLVYGRDRPGSLATKLALNEEHWAYMDGYADRMVARGPTLASDDEEAEPTGSLHIVDVPDVAAARAFAHEEPYYLGGAFETVDVLGFRNLVGRTMWDFTGGVEGLGRWLVISLDASVEVPVDSRHLIVGGHLLDPDDGTHVGAAALVESPDHESAAAMLPAAGAEVRPWRFGGRPDPGA